jgi:hypothetical protein
LLDTLRLHVMLDVAAHDPRLILQLSPGPLECIVDGERQIKVPLILPRCMVDMNLTTVRQSELNAYAILGAALVMSSRPPSQRCEQR